LGLGDDAGLEGVGQNDVLVADMGLEDFVEPCPVHGGFENNTGFGIALGQLDEEFWGGVLDTPAFKDAAFGVEDAKNAVSLMEAIPIETGQLWDGVGLVIRPPILQHPFYRIPEPDPPADQGGIMLSCRLTPLRADPFY
jgi:hypothetical protein